MLLQHLDAEQTFPASCCYRLSVGQRPSSQSPIAPAAFPLNQVENGGKDDYVSIPIVLSSLHSSFHDPSLPAERRASGASLGPTSRHWVPAGTGRITTHIQMKLATHRRRCLFPCYPRSQKAIQKVLGVSSGQKLRQLHSHIGV